MNKSELVNVVAKEAEVSQSITKQVLDVMIEVIMGEVDSGRYVQIPGFGKFHPVDRPERSGKSPFDGKPYTTPAHTVPKFKPSQEFKERVR